MEMANVMIVIAAGMARRAQGVSPVGLCVRQFARLNQMKWLAIAHQWMSHQVPQRTITRPVHTGGSPFLAQFGQDLRQSIDE